MVMMMMVAGRLLRAVLKRREVAALGRLLKLVGEIRKEAGLRWIGGLLGRCLQLRSGARRYLLEVRGIGGLELLEFLKQLRELREIGAVGRGSPGGRCQR